MALDIDISGLASGAINIGIMILSIVFFVALIVGGLFWWNKYKQYSGFKCVIWDREGNESYDSAGIFVDKKTNNKRFFLKNHNVGLNPDRIPFRRVGNTKVVYLLRDGLKNFRFIKVSVGNPVVNLNVSEEDVNWAINAYDRQKKLFQNSLLMQLLPFMLIAFVSIIILIIFIYFFRNFSVLKDVASALTQAARAIASAQGGTAIIE